MVHVPYRGNLQAVADLVDGRVQAGLIATFQSEWTETKKAGGAAAWPLAARGQQGERVVSRSFRTFSFG